MIRLIEELSLNAWPALQTMHYDGWVVCCAAGYTRRANAVYPLYPSMLDLREKIAHCEQVYRAWGQDTVFKLTSAAQPADLDEALDAAGYRLEASTSVMTCDLSGGERPHLHMVTLDSDLTDHWLETFTRLSAITPHRLPTLTHILNNIIPARCFITLEHEGRSVAAGVAVAEQGYVGLFNIITDAAWRNRGLGTQLVLHLLDWGRSQGAEYAYLQVMEDNAPALHVYHKLRFQRIYSYWYRIKQTSPAPTGR
jgi:ribosomal protein S18 acetylase RimI-like enzyme